MNGRIWIALAALLLLACGGEETVVLDGVDVVSPSDADPFDAGDGTPMGEDGGMDDATDGGETSEPDVGAPETDIEDEEQGCISDFREWQQCENGIITTQSWRARPGWDPDWDCDAPEPFVSFAEVCPGACEGLDFDSRCSPHGLDICPLGILGSWQAQCRDAEVEVRTCVPITGDFCGDGLTSEDCSVVAAVTCERGCGRPTFLEGVERLNPPVVRGVGQLPDWFDPEELCMPPGRSDGLDYDFGRPEGWTHPLPEPEPEPVEPPDPLRILFIGNSFTFGGPIPRIVDTLANDAGWPDPDVEYVAFPGETLTGHRGRDETVGAVDEGNWDVVVIQENSVRPTDGRGRPETFKEDATWFYDRIKTSSPDARVILFETWARHPDHEYYPGSFDDPADMQAQLRFHYNDAADRYIPENATMPPGDDVVVAPVGDAWENHLAEENPARLHHPDDWHAGTNGQYLTALVIYATIYGRATEGLTPWSTVPATAARLQATADRTTGETTPGGPEGVALIRGMEIGERVWIDFGGVETDIEGASWTNITDAVDGAAFNVETTEGVRTTVDVVISDAFSGVNPEGNDENELGYPASASSDTIWIGSFDGHSEALSAFGQVQLGGLDPAGRYDLVIYASRTGTDSGNGRLTRYTIGDATEDLEVANNTGDTASFRGIAPSADGTIDVDVTISPDGGSRFAYIGVLDVTRVE